MRLLKAKSTLAVGIVLVALSGLTVGTNAHAICQLGCHTVHCFTYGTSTEWPCYYVSGYAICPRNATPIWKDAQTNAYVCDIVAGFDHTYRCGSCYPDCEDTPSVAGSCDIYEVVYFGLKNRTECGPPRS